MKWASVTNAIDKCQEFLGTIVWVVGVKNTCAHKAL